MPLPDRTLLASAMLALMLATPAAAQDKPAETQGEKQAEPAKPAEQGEAPRRPIRNAPPPRALELAAYIFSASNVCGYPIGVPAFEALLAKQNVRPEDVSPRGPFGARVQGMFALMSNQMSLNREQACLAVAGEYGPEGNVAKSVLLPPGAQPEPKPGDKPPGEPAK